MTTDVPAADAPVGPRPPGFLDLVSRFIGEVARPYVLIALGTAVAKAVWFGGSDSSAVITAGGGVLAIIYGAKAAEVAIKGHNEAKVAAAQISAQAAPAQAPDDGSQGTR